MLSRLERNYARTPAKEFGAELGNASESKINPFERFFSARMRPLLDERDSTQSDPIVLVEEKPYPLYHVASGVLAAVLAVESNARIVSFRFSGRQSFMSRLRRTAPLTPLGLDAYETMSDQRIIITPRLRHERRSRRLVRVFASSRPTRSDLEAFTVDGIHLGHLIIDRIVQKGHLRIDPVHPELLAMMEKMVARALVFRDELSQRRVEAVITGDIAYSPGLPLKTAIAGGVAAFIAHHRQIRRLDNSRPVSFMDFMDYREGFAALTVLERLRACDLAEEFLTARFYGGKGFSASGAAVWSRDPRLTPRSAAPVRTVLVSAHSFWDAQHAGGGFLFPDFFSWLEHLVGLARRSGYRWRIKLHPDQRDVGIGVEPQVRALIGDVPNVELVPNDVSNATLMAEGVDLVATVYGTVAMEFPWLGVPAVTARWNSVHSPYSYALHPASVEELDRILLDPTRWEYPIDREEILEYVFMHYLCNTNVLYDMLDEERFGADPQSLDSWPVAPDWDDAISDRSFETTMDLIRAWVRSGTHGLNHWVGRSRRFAELRTATDPET